MTARSSIRAHLFAGFAVIGVAVFGAGAWAASTDLAGAVVTSGVLVVESYVKKVQHREGGTVAAIFARDGDRVKAGDVLIRLDGALIEANLSLLNQQFNDLSTRLLRLVAERDGAPNMAQPEDPVPEALFAAEQELFMARSRALNGQRAQLFQRRMQARREIQGLVSRWIGKGHEISFISHELQGVSQLEEHGLVTLTRLMALRRAKAQLMGERGQFLSEIARVRAQITETDLQILQLGQDRLNTVLDDLRNTDIKLAEVREKRLAMLDQRARLQIRAPQDGVVTQTTVHTVGGVAGPGETLMLIVPDHDPLVAETRVRPSDIDQVRPQQNVILRFPGLNRRSTPEVVGQVETVSADLARDPVNGDIYYTARLRIPEEARQRLAGVTLTAGMPVEAYIQTGSRSVLSYLTKPLYDYAAHAFKEE